MKRIAHVFILIFCVVPLMATYAQEGGGRDTPSWVEYEKGVLALSQREYGQALFSFKKALARARVMPEAELGIGDVYF
ncbi:MAG TPA: hypothetical protein ENN69_00195, partial [Spirochaetia bacterium]|nr:hypothetical protein [Spirochaetia bacterium]